MSPADIVNFTPVQSSDGETLRAVIEGTPPPISRETAMHMILAAALLLEEAEAEVESPRLLRRMQLLRARMADAMDREKR